MQEQSNWENLSYKVLFAVFWLLSLLPLCILYLLSNFLFLIFYHCIGYRHRVVRQNLVGSFPDKSESEIKSIEKKFYHFFCDYFFETIKLASISKSEMKRRMKFKNTDGLVRAYTEEHKNFVFIYLGHYCNWEWVSTLPASLPTEIHCGQIYHPLYNKVFNKFFLRLRENFGAKSIPMKDTLRRIAEQSRAKQPTMIGFISDQLPKLESTHFFVPFLNRDTAVFTGAEQIGKRINAAYFYADITRPRRGFYECTFIPINTDKNQQSPFPITELFMQHLEQSIHNAPQYWLWTHKRWKRTKEEWEQHKQHMSTKKQPGKQIS